MARALAVSLLLLGVASLAALPARADEAPTSWEEPTLEEALARAAVVARARVVDRGESQPPRGLLGLEDVIAGRAAPGAEVAVVATTATSAIPGIISALHAGDEAIFVLQPVISPAPGAPALAAATPTFGRFPIRNGQVVAALRDSFVRVSLPVEVYADFLRNAWKKTHGEAAGTAWLDSCRSTLRTLDPASPAATTAAHVALEGLCYGATEKDAELALRFFASQRFQVRISAARLLERSGGPRAAEGLLRLATRDDDPAVRATATLALARVTPLPAAAPAELARALDTAEASSISLHASADDPRTNELPSPLGAALEVLRGLGRAADATPHAVALLSRDDGDVIANACLHLVRAKETVRVSSVVEQMRPAGYKWSLPNQLISAALEELTGQRLGTDREAWRAWVASGGSSEKK